MPLAQLIIIGVGTLFTSIGLVFILGAFLKWKWLIDPDKKYVAIYSQAKIKEIFGETFLLFFTYFLGILFTLIGVFTILNALSNSTNWAF